MSETSKFTFEESKLICRKALDYLIAFSSQINQGLGSDDFTKVIQELNSLNMKIHDLHEPTLPDEEFNAPFTRILQILINWNPIIQRQLQLFWHAQIEFGNESLDGNNSGPYDPLKLVNTNIDKINSVNDLYITCKNQYHKNPKEKTNLYALFYSHILKTETMEYSFRQDFDNLIQKFRLHIKYDSYDIFSVTGKIPKGDKFRTDARAIRDSLAHYCYSINKTEHSWEIIFDNKEDGYDFQKTFLEDDFLLFLENTDLLYKSQLHLLWIFIANLVGSQAFVTKK